MESYQFCDTLLVRCPLYSFEELSVDDPISLLQTDVFRTAIFLASRSFYEELEKRDFQYSRLTEKLKHTLRKYANRATFRSTPFGLFSTYSVTRWSERRQSGIVLADVQATVRPDFAVLHRLWKQYIKDQVSGPVGYRANSTMAASKVDFRYSVAVSGPDERPVFSVVSVPKTSVLKKVLRFCAEERAFTEIVGLVSVEAASTVEDASAFVKELICQQVLEASHQPSVTGVDYAERLASLFAVLPEGRVAPALQEAVQQMAFNLPAEAEKLRMLTDVLEQHLPGGAGAHSFYAVSSRAFTGEGLSKRYQQSIREGLSCLNRLCTARASQDLEQFKKAFLERYAEDEVPLLDVLDPQFGLGYGSFEQLRIDYGVVSRSELEPFSGGRRAEESDTEVAGLLMSEWQNFKGAAHSEALEITDEHLAKLTKPASEGFLPPSISVLFRTLGDRVYIDCAGGASALSLLGRFAFDEKIFKMARSLGEQEQQVNPGVLFAEIAHVCHLHTANINRRPHLRDYEIPVLTHSTIEKKGQVHLCDLVVSVKNGVVVLRCKKRNRVVVPRLSSAFNYMKNTFPIFRFLCDLQEQGLKTGLRFSLAALLPGLHFYPRVTYKSCILQLAEWHLKENDLRPLRGQEPAEAFRLFAALARHLKLPRFFAYSIHDHFLIVDAENAQDVGVFLKEAEHNTTVIVREFPFLQEAFVTNAQGQPYASDYIAALYLNKAVYKTELEERTSRHGRAHLKDTEDWLYFKIYCHPLCSDIVFCSHLLPLLEQGVREEMIQDWFWIRYMDPDYHLRVRIRTRKEHYGAVLSLFTTCLNKLYADQLVRQFRTDVYRRELERFSAQLMLAVEKVFCASCRMVARFLKKKDREASDGVVVLKEAVWATYAILNAVGFDQQRIAGLSKLSFEQFFLEFGSPKAFKSELEGVHKGLCAELTAGLHQQQQTRRYRLLRIPVLQVAADLQRRKVRSVLPQKLAADLVHMHLNRLFVYEQRYYEMITYFLLYRTLCSVIYRPAKGVQP